jgi:hypothetical protein
LTITVPITFAAGFSEPNAKVVYGQIVDRAGVNSGFVALGSFTLQTSATGQPATLVSPAPGSTLPGAQATFSWTSGVNVQRYWFDLGNAPATADIRTGEVAGTSVTVTGIPADGRTVYAALYSWIGNDWVRPPQMYTFTAGTTAPPNYTLTVAPASAAWLAGTSRSFTVTVAGTGGFNGAVALTATGMPAGSVVTFNPATVTGSGTSTMTVQTLATDNGGVTGTFAITAMGTSGALTRSDAAQAIL